MKKEILFKYDRVKGYLNNNDDFKELGIEKGVFFEVSSLHQVFTERIWQYESITMYHDFVNYIEMNEETYVVDKERQNVTLLYKVDEEQFYSVSSEGVQEKLLTLSEKEFDVLCRFMDAALAIENGSGESTDFNIEKKHYNYVDALSYIDEEHLILEKVEEKLKNIIEKSIRAD